jgi:hypothetical protein
VAANTIGTVITASAVSAVKAVITIDAVGTSETVGAVTAIHQGCKPLRGLLTAVHRSEFVTVFIPPVAVY